MFSADHHSLNIEGPTCEVVCISLIQYYTYIDSKVIIPVIQNPVDTQLGLITKSLCVRSIGTDTKSCVRLIGTDTKTCVQ